jgi:hypothetical protein
VDIDVSGSGHHVLTTQGSLMRNACVAVVALCGCASEPADNSPDSWCEFAHAAGWSEFHEPDPRADAVRAALRNGELPETLCPERPDRCAIRWFKNGNARVGFCQETFGCSVDVVEFREVAGQWKWHSGNIWVACDHGVLTSQETSVEHAREH